MVINELYGLQDISDEEFHDRMCPVLTASGGQSSDIIPFRNTVRASMMVPPELIMAAVKDIYNDTIKEGDLSPELFEGISNVIQTACKQGMSQSSFDPDDEFKRQLMHSADVFSAFKVHSAQQAIASKLLDDQGNLRSFSDFQKAVAPIVSHQCGRWLRTEYDTAVIRAHQAADWQQFLDEANVFPNLEWMPSTSVTPGADHQVFWGTILPINDPFWTQHRPGDRWNCKCSLQATDANPTPRPRGFSEIVNAPQPGLDTNPGADGAVFSKTHPYFPKTCSECPFNDGKQKSTFTNGLIDCYYCRNVARCISRVRNATVYIPDREFGNRLMVSLCADENELEDNMRVAKALLRKFPNLKIEITEHIESKNQRFTNPKNPEYRINGSIADRKGIEGENVASSFGKALKQGCSMVVIDLDAQASKRKRPINMKNLANKINGRHLDFKSGRITDCFVVYRDNAVVIHGYNDLESIKAILKQL